MTTAKPAARYGSIRGALPGGFALPSYIVTGTRSALCMACPASTSSVHAGESLVIERPMDLSALTQEACVFRADEQGMGASYP